MARKLRLLSGGVILAIGLISGGCSGSKPAADSPGAKVFASAGCGSCHTLEAAGAKGQVGPNLDELKPDESTVAHQVRVGGNGMPSFRKRLASGQIEEVASFVAEASRSSGTGAAFEPDDTTVGSCEKSGKPYCYRQAFGNIAYKDGPEKALALLATDDRAMEQVHADCHQIAHWVGHAGLAHYKGNAADALAHGGMTCNSGYYHGVLQVALAGLPKDEVVRKARRLCTAPAVNTDAFLLYQCVHGLGHGLMIYSGNELPWSLQTCHKLQTSFDRISCTGGVFMQNLDTTMGTSRYLRAKNPLYPCTIVSEQDKLYCYLMVTSRILSLDGFRLAQDRGLVPKERARLGRDLLPVVRPRRVGDHAVPLERDDQALQDRGQGRQRVHVRRGARLREQLRGRERGRAALQCRSRALPSPLLRGDRHDPRRAPHASARNERPPATRSLLAATGGTASRARPSSESAPDLVTDCYLEGLRPAGCAPRARS